MQNDAKQAEIFVTTEQWTTLSDLFGLVDKKEHVDHIRDLIAAGFPVHAKSDFGLQKFNLAELAATYESRDLVLYLQQAYPDMVNGSAHVLRMTLEDEGAIEHLVAGGYPLASIIADDPGLMGAVCQSWNIGLQNIRILAEHGLRLDAVADIQGAEALPMTWLGEMLRAKVIDGFLHAGADPGAVDANGRHFLHQAVTEGRTKRTDKDDSEFSSTNFEKVLEVAVAHGVNLDIQDKDGNSALHLAAKMGYPNKARLLLERGACTSLCNNKGKTPAQLATAAKRTNILHIFAVEAARQAIMQVASAAKAPRQ